MKVKEKANVGVEGSRRRDRGVVVSEGKVWMERCSGNHRVGVNKLHWWEANDAERARWKRQ